MNRRRKCGGYALKNLRKQWREIWQQPKGGFTQLTCLPSLLTDPLSTWSQREASEAMFLCGCPLDAVSWPLLGYIIQAGLILPPRNLEFGSREKTLSCQLVG